MFGRNKPKRVEMIGRDIKEEVYELRYNPKDKYDYVYIKADSIGKIIKKLEEGKAFVIADEDIVDGIDPLFINIPLIEFIQMIKKEITKKTIYTCPKCSKQDYEVIKYGDKVCKTCVE